MGAEPLQASAWADIFCWLGELFLKVSLQFSSSIRFVNSSILSLRAEICSESWLMAPYNASDDLSSVQLHEIRIIASDWNYLIYLCCRGIWISFTKPPIVGKISINFGSIFVPLICIWLRQSTVDNTQN